MKRLSDEEFEGMLESVSAKLSNDSRPRMLMLGGLSFMLPAIKAAHEESIAVITVDYLPDNIAHKHSDAYLNISVTDINRVLEAARKLEVAGVMAYAVDPAVETAAYVCEQLGLPFAGNYESVKILQNKNLFRNFLEENDFNTPKWIEWERKKEIVNEENVKLKPCDYSNYEQLLPGEMGKIIEMMRERGVKWPVIIKPVDSAGSKGVSRVNGPVELGRAVANALKYSRSGKLIIEEFIVTQGFSSGSECFIRKGKLIFCSYSSQMFDDSAPNPYAPIGNCWPSLLPSDIKKEGYLELQRLINLLKLTTGIFNVEMRVGVNGKLYIMEVSPRAGGNRLPEIIENACGQPLIRNAVRAAVGRELIPMEHPKYTACHSDYVIHSRSKGAFQSVVYSPAVTKYLKEIDLWVSEGEEVPAFTGANTALGVLKLQFPTLEEGMDFWKTCSKNMFNNNFLIDIIVT